MEFISAIPPLGARTSQTRKEVNFRLPYEHCKSEVCGRDHMRVMLKRESRLQPSHGDLNEKPTQTTLYRAGRFNVSSAEPTLRDGIAMKWIIVILSMNARGHPFIANSSWMDGGNYDSLGACMADVGRQKALHPDQNVVSGGSAAVWECLAVDSSQSKTLVPHLNGDWQ